MTTQLRRPRRHDPTGEAPTVNPSTLARREIHAVLQAMEDNPSHAWTIAALAELACLSPSALQRAFALDVGMTPMARLGHIRVAVMARLLRETDDLVQEVARHAGWRNRGHAARQFTKLMGVTPSAYRAEYRRRARRTADDLTGCPWCGQDLPAPEGVRDPRIDVPDPGVSDAIPGHPRADRGKR